MKRLLTLFTLLLLVFAAQAQQRQLACLPGYVLPQWPEAKATPLMQGKVEGVAGEWSQIWCPEAVPGQLLWVYRSSYFAVLDKYRATPAAIVAGIVQVVQAANPLAEAQRLLDGGAVLPPAGSLDRYQFDLLLNAACNQGLALPPADANTEGMRCAPPPLRPYVVKANGTAADRPVYPLAAGVRSTTAVPGVRAAVGARCDQAAAQAAATGTDLYAAFAPEYRADRVTLCSAVK